MKINTSSEPVKLRMRTLPDGRQSLYLDIYFAGGRRKYEYLRLYLVPDTGKEAREANRDTMRLAEAVRARRSVDYQEGRLGLTARRGDENADFVQFFRSLIEEGQKNHSWKNTLIHLTAYTRGRKVAMRDVTREWLEGFKRYLLDEAVSLRGTGEEMELGTNTCSLYFSKVRAAVREACRRRIMSHNPLDEVRGIRTEEVERAYLTLAEVRRLAASECESAVLRRAFLFSCLTGLRKSDIIALRWEDVREENGYTRIVFRQQKTRGQEYLDIAPEAVRYLGERGLPTARPFGAFRYSERTNEILREWADRAGITKYVTFHTGRHTFAVIMLELGTDIYTLQKLLGHRNINTTQIYAKMLDEGKRRAVARIPSIESPEGEE